jgi:hypothetical protein
LPFALSRRLNPPFPNIISRFFFIVQLESEADCWFAGILINFKMTLRGGKFPNFPTFRTVPKQRSGNEAKKVREKNMRGYTLLRNVTAQGPPNPAP